MSTIRCEVVALTDVRPHPDAERLDLATIKGWQMVVPKGLYADGDKVVYFEAGTVIPPELAERLGVANYLQNKLDIDGNRVGVIGRVRLRGEPSFGLIIPVEDPSWELGRDVTEHFGATKFMPPVKHSAGDADVDHPQFQAYTDIENMRSFPDVFVDGEEVEASEKLHGTNCRVGYAIEEGDLLWMAGSRTLRRKDPGSENQANNTYWRPLTIPAVKDMLTSLYNHGHKQAELFGEVFGKGVQNYDYGTNTPQFRAFDLMVDGQYVDRDKFYAWCASYGVETCPVLYRGPYSLAAIKGVSDGDSQVGGTKGREGVVVRPVVERNHPRIGRVILKYIGDTYLFGKKGGGAEDFTDQ